MKKQTEYRNMFLVDSSDPRISDLLEQRLLCGTLTIDFKEGFVRYQCGSLTLEFYAIGIEDRLETDHIIEAEEMGNYYVFSSDQPPVMEREEVNEDG